MWVNHAQVKCSKRQIRISQCNKHRTIDSRITLIGANIRLDGLSIPHITILTDVGQRRVRNVQLTNPENELWCVGRGGGDVAVVRPNWLSWVLPLEEDLTSWVGERDGAVLRDGCGAIVAGLVALDAGVLIWNIGV